MRKLGISDVSIYLDVWVSLNNRFTQRMYDPNVDIVVAEWSIFERPKWVMPLMTEFNSWRHVIKAQLDRLDDSSSFFADFPNLSMVNYVEPDYGNSTQLEVLIGGIMVERDDGQVAELNESSRMYLSSGHFYRLRPHANQAACYVYRYANYSEPATKSEDSTSDVGLLHLVPIRLAEVVAHWTRSAQLSAVAVRNLARWVVAR